MYPITQPKCLDFAAFTRRPRIIKSLFCSLILSLLPATVIAAQTTLLPGDMSLGPAVGNQSNPVIAAGVNGYLAVWEDFRSTPYIGPPFSTEGSGSDIYAQLLDASGQPISDLPIPLSTRFGDQLAPQVAWNGENWLVTWRTTCECWSFSYHIQGVRVSPTGVILDPKPLIIHTNAADSGWDHFRLTANGTEWLVVIAEQRAVRINASGNMINNGGTELVDTTSLTFFELYASQGEY